MAEPGGSQGSTWHVDTPDESVEVADVKGVELDPDSSVLTMLGTDGTVVAVFRTWTYANRKDADRG